MAALDGLPSLARRRWLIGALGVVGALLAGGGGLLALRGSAPAVSGLRCLSAQEYRTLRQLALALYPPGGAFATGADSVDLARAFDGYLADEPEYNLTDLRRALGWLEFGPVLYDRRAKTFSHLGPEERLAHFEGWLTSSTLLRRQVALALRKFMSLVFYDTPEVWPALGYDGPLFRRPEAP